MRKLRLISIILLFTIAVTGCWDKIEIEDRAFVLALGIDKASEAEAAVGDKYLISLVNPDTAEAKEGKVFDFVTFETVASSLAMGATKLLQRSAKSHSYEHTSTIIFGEELMKDEDMVKDILDVFSRGHQFNSSMLVFMTEGKAKEIFEVKPKMRSLFAFYITGIAENEKLSARVSKLTFLNFIKQLADNQGTAVMPCIAPSEEGLKISDMAVFKNYRYIGKLDEKETIAYKWLTGKVKGGVLGLNNPPYEAPFIYSDSKHRITLDKIEGNKIYIAYNMQAEGTVEEYVIDSKLFEDYKIKYFEKEFEKIMDKDCKDLIKKLQEEYKVDIIGVREYLYKHHPKLYDSISANFNDYFERNIIIEVKSDIKVRRVGKTP